MVKKLGKPPRTLVEMVPLSSLRTPSLPADGTPAPEQVDKPPQTEESFHGHVQGAQPSPGSRAGPGAGRLSQEGGEGWREPGRGGSVLRRGEKAVPAAGELGAPRGSTQKRAEGWDKPLLWVTRVPAV